MQGRDRRVKTDFSALRKRRKDWTPLLYLLIIAVFVGAATVSLATGNLVIFQLLAIVFVVVLFAAAGVIFVWGLRVFIKRALRVARHEPLLHDETYATLQQFAATNGFEFETFSREYPAPQELYTQGLHDLKANRQHAEVYLLFMTTGFYAGATFTYYCVAVDDGRSRMGPGPNQGAYEYAQDGHILRYLTILAVDRPINKTSERGLDIVNEPNGRVLCQGMATDRETVQKMFTLLEAET